MTELHPYDADLIKKLNKAMIQRNAHDYRNHLGDITRQDLKLAIEALQRPRPKPPGREPGLYAVKMRLGQEEWDIAHHDVGGFWSVVGSERAFAESEFVEIGEKVMLTAG